MGSKAFSVSGKTEPWSWNDSREKVLSITSSIYLKQDRKKAITKVYNNSRCKIQEDWNESCWLHPHCYVLISASTPHWDFRFPKWGRNETLITQFHFENFCAFWSGWQKGRHSETMSQTQTTNLSVMTLLSKIAAVMQPKSATNALM